MLPLIFSSVIPEKNLDLFLPYAGRSAYWEYKVYLFSRCYCIPLRKNTMQSLHCFTAGVSETLRLLCPRLLPACICMCMSSKAVNLKVCIILQCSKMQQTLGINDYHSCVKVLCIMCMCAVYQNAHN